MTTFDYVIIIGFLAVMGLGGFFLSRLIKDADDFFVAGRELTPSSSPRPSPPPTFRCCTS